MTTSAWATDETKIIKFSDMIFHNGCPVAEFSAPVFVVAGPDGD